MITKTWTTRSRTTPPNCPRCEALSGQTVAEHRFFTAPGTIIFEPPLHPHCDCTLTYGNTNETPESLSRSEE